MSRQFVVTKLMGHAPIRLPEEVSRDLFAVLESGDQFQWTNVDLIAACGQLHLPYPKAYIPFAETEDGYDWFWGQAFILPSEVMVILLVPWKKDVENKDGSTSDRLPNMYIIGRPIELVTFTSFVL